MGIYKNPQSLNNDRICTSGETYRSTSFLFGMCDARVLLLTILTKKLGSSMLLIILTSNIWSQLTNRRHHLGDRKMILAILSHKRPEKSRQVDKNYGKLGTDNFENAVRGKEESVFHTQMPFPCCQIRGLVLARSTSVVRISNTNEVTWSELPAAQDDDGYQRLTWLILIKNVFVLSGRAIAGISK